MNERDRLIVDNMKLVYSMVNKYYPTYKTNEDVIQEGMLGLVKAADTFNKSKGKFSTYAVKCILNQIKMYFRQEMKQPMTVSLDYPIILDDGNETSVYDLIMGEEDVTPFYADWDLFYKSLSEREQEILDLSLIHTETEIGEMIGVSQSYISQVKNGVKKKWRRFNGKDTY